MKKIKEAFTDGWKFHYGDIDVLHPVKSGMAGGLTSSADVEEGEWLKIAYFDECEVETPKESEWQDVAIPHDWCVENCDYRDDKGAVKHHKSHGYLDAGVGFYRKTFRIPKEWEGKKIGLEFGGVFRNCTIWVNGFEVLRHESGYTGFWCEMTDVLRYGDEGENVILVRVDAREYEGWWYEGAGIYRKVWLEVSEKVHLTRHGVYVAAEEVTYESAKIKAELTVENETDQSRLYDIEGKILDRQGEVCAKFSARAEVDQKDSNTYTVECQVQAPALWSPEHPYLYCLDTKLLKDGEEIEHNSTEFGIKTVAFDAEKGFLLNGERYLLKGTCNHQDFAGVGVALPDSLIEYKLKKLKEMGSNAYRSAHHPASQELLELCDRMGHSRYEREQKTGQHAAGDSRAGRTDTRQ